ncbi:hypothetical protein [Streptomyces sp. S3(2020)]|uniref:hypothetical protein n=1 Tax=Streptomyces sp. S3(2020) TaxID=2732044 RepID=UPI0019CFADC8|nr:hypothetical protein [Streptomyces sp. S3(2020)]
MAKYARATSWQECARRAPPQRTTSLNPYLEYLQQRWDEGEHTARVLHQEITAKGYQGHYQRVKMAIAAIGAATGSVIGHLGGWRRGT